jgi:RNA polymerase sigma factor (sigma-70 family)
MANKSLNGVFQHICKLAAVQSAQQLGDHELLKRFAAGNDEAAFTVLVQRHAPMILGVCRRLLGNTHDAEDACQTAFLVLAQKAASIRKTTSLPSWLHGVALRVAAHLRRERIRRCKREQEGKPAAMTDPAEDVSWREVQAVLDEELDRLPEQLRGPLILCYLDGRTRDEAAQRLGLSVACLHGRLERGRKMLCQRLVKRGVTLSAALLATAIGEGVSRAALSPATVLHTAQAAVLIHAGRALDPGLVSPKILALAQEVPTKMLLTKLKIGASALLGAGLLVTALGGSLSTLGAERETKAPPAREIPAARQAPEALAAVLPQADKDGPTSAPAGDTETVTITGQVITANGKPAAGAKVSVCFAGPLLWLATPADGSARKPLHAVADAEGRFAIPVPRSERDMGVKIVATAEGLGPDWVEVSAHNAEKVVTLRLRADDVVLEGRIFDLERRPVAGAVIEVRSLERPADSGDLKAWIAAQARMEQRLFPRPAMKSLPVEGVVGIPASATTDKAGRFRLTGLGRETVVQLSVRGEGVENTSIEVCTRNDKAALISPRTYPARFELLLGPGKVVTGTVTEKGTGKPIAGAAVSVDDSHGHTDD